MIQVTKIIFAVGNGNTRAPMAAAIFNHLYEKNDIEAVSRGLSVAFEEPMNPKAEAVLISNDMEWPDYTSKELMNYEITDRTMIFTMEKKQRDRIIETYESASEHNTFVLSEYVGDELEILDPYGGTLQTFGMCYEVIRGCVEKLISGILEGGLYIEREETGLH